MNVIIGRRKDWRQLLKVARGDHGLANLRHPKIVFDWEKTELDTEDDGTVEMLIEWVNEGCDGHSCQQASKWGSETAT
jgi:hypothetical protein